MPFGLRAGLKRLIALPRRSSGRVRADLDEELRFFLEARIEQLVTQGMSRSDAEREALRRLGGDFPHTREQLHRSAQHLERRMRWQQWLDDVRHDLRYSTRSLLHARGFAAAVVLTLGLAIGANAAMFGLVDRLLLRPPGFLRDADQVHRVYRTFTFRGTEGTGSTISYTLFRELSEGTTAFDRTAGFARSGMAVGEGVQSTRADVQGVTASFFSFFDARPALGRFFTSAEDVIPVGAAVVVLGYGYWQTHFGGSPDVIGQRLRIGPRPFEIIGVAPAGFTGVDLTPPSMIIPLTALGALMAGPDPSQLYTGYGWNWMDMIVHRRPGVSVTMGDTDLTTAFRRAHAAWSDPGPGLERTDAVPPRALLAPPQVERGPSRGNESRVASWLIGVTVVVLLVACANVANLLLARAFGRRREIAVRLALGVSRGRLLSQLLLESLLLAVAGGVLGLLIAHWGGALLGALFIPGGDWDGALADPRTLWFTIGATLLAGLLAGLVPALQGGRTDVAESLKAGVREGTSQRSRTRTALMVAQAALSVVLLVGAGLFVRSLQNVRGLDLGFDADVLLHVSVDLRSTELTAGELTALKEQMRQRAASLPQVQSAARARTVPFTLSMARSLFVPGIDSVDRLGTFLLQSASSEYFETVGTRVLRGRGILPSDVAGTPPVMVVSAPMAKALWPGEDPIGKCVRVGADTMPCHQVVGVAEPYRRRIDREEPGFQYYLPIDQQQPDEAGLFVRTRGDARAHAQAVRRELQLTAPGDAFVRVRTLAEIIDPSVRSWRLGATLFVAFGGLALVLATLGLYSVVAYLVVQRTHELGVRVALGARRRDLLRLVIGQGLRLALTGVALGGAIALAAGRFIEPLLFAQSPRDPLVLGIVALALLGTAMLACLVPARRAARMDPLMALRSD